MENIAVRAGSVVVGVDGSAASERAVLWGAHQAQLEHRPLALVHGCSPTVATTWLGSASYNPADLLQALEDSGRTLLTAAASTAHAVDPTLEVHRVFDRHDPRESLVDLSRRAALVVMGSRGHGPVGSLLLGSVSLAVAQHASCPVVVVRTDGERSSGGIVVGSDGTVRSDAAVGFAFRQASLTGLPLTVVHAFWSEQHTNLTEVDLDQQRLLLSEGIAGPCGDYPEVKVTLHVEHGIADKVLLHACETADLIVVGTHPTRVLHDLLAGEVSRSVLGRAHCPVAVVRDTM